MSWIGNSAQTSASGSKHAERTLSCAPELICHPVEYFQVSYIHTQLAAFQEPALPHSRLLFFVCLFYSFTSLNTGLRKQCLTSPDLRVGRNYSKLHAGLQIDLNLILMRKDDRKAGERSLSKLSRGQRLTRRLKTRTKGKEKNHKKVNSHCQMFCSFLLCSSNSCWRTNCVLQENPSASIQVNKSF